MQVLWDFLVNAGIRTLEAEKFFLKLHGSQTHVLFEKSGKISWILELQIVGDLGDAEIGLHQLPLGFQNNSFMNQLSGCFASGVAEGFIEAFVCHI